MSEDFFDLSGQATAWEDPYPEKGRCQVGGKSVWVFRFVYGTDDEVNPNYEALRDAARAEQWVKVTGKQDIYAQGPARGKPRRTVYDVLQLESDVIAKMEGGAGNGSTGKTGTPGPIPDVPGVARASQHFSDDRQRIIGAQWAINAAIALGDPKLQGVSETFRILPFEEKAKYLKALARDLAEEPEQRTLGAGAPPTTDPSGDTPSAAPAPANPPEPETVPAGWGE